MTGDGQAGDGHVPSVVIVTDVYACAEALAAWLTREAGLSVHDVAVWEPDAQPASDVRADVALVQVAGTDGTAAVRWLRETAPAARVVAVGIPARRQEVVMYAEAGACAYVAADAPLEELAAVVRAAARGEAILSPPLAALLLEHVAATARSSRYPSTLSPRELQTLRLIDEGLTNKEIATKLHVEGSTIKSHVHSILKKLGVRRRSEAAAVFRAYAGHAEPSGVAGNGSAPATPWTAVRTGPGPDAPDAVGT